MSPQSCEGGVTVRWCPRCGTCTCPEQNGNPDRWVEDPACPIHGYHSKHAEPLLIVADVGGPIPLNRKQIQAVQDWASDYNLWGSKSAIEFNLYTFARVILKHANETEGR